MAGPRGSGEFANRSNRLSSAVSTVSDPVADTSAISVYDSDDSTVRKSEERAEVEWEKLDTYTVSKAQRFVCCCGVCPSR